MLKLSLSESDLIDSMMTRASSRKWSREAGYGPVTSRQHHPRLTFVRADRAQASAALILVHELRREIIGKGSYLERGSTATWVKGVQLDPIKLIIGKDRDELIGETVG